MIARSAFLDCSPARAFELFTARASDWWPSERRHTADARSLIRLVESGRFWERASDGCEVELGRVTAWQPPDRLVFDFYPGTDVEHPTEVTVTFTLEGTRTRVDVEHRPKPESAALWAERVHRYEGSWELLLIALARAA